MEVISYTSEDVLKPLSIVGLYLISQNKEGLKDDKIQRIWTYRCNYRLFWRVGALKQAKPLFI